MSIVSHLHHLFPTLKLVYPTSDVALERSALQCPRCQSPNVGPLGVLSRQPGLKRYRCKEKGCKGRTFQCGEGWHSNEKNDTLLDSLRQGFQRDRCPTAPTRHPTR